MDEERFDTRLRQLLDEFGIESTQAQRQLLLRHLSLVIEKNQVVNLTRIVDPDSALVLHILDSLLLLSQVGNAPEGPFVDIGTGAGFPGVPLGIMTARNGTLVDSVGKKTQAVSDFIDELGLGRRLRTWHGRIEDLGHERPRHFAVSVCRAVAQTNILVEYASPLLFKGGRLVITKGKVTDEETAAGRRAAAICGMRPVSRETYELPGDLGHREILVYEKIGAPKIRLPRRPGTARRDPLGL